MEVVYPDAPVGLDALEYEQKLQPHGLVFCYHEGAVPDTPTYLERLGSARYMLLGWGISDEVLRAASHLELVSFTGIGAGNFVNLQLARELGITVCNTPGYADVTVAEHTFALLLGVAKRVTELGRDVRAGGWSKELEGFDLAGKTIGLVGFGGIGQHVARLARAFGMQILVWTRTPQRYVAHVDGDLTFVSLTELMERSDVVSLHCAHTPETEGLLDAPLLQRLKSDAVIINTARGEIVDESALLQMLQDKRIRGAGLDVFANEPLPDTHAWRSLDNVVVTPHTAYNTPGATARIMEIALDNVIAYVQGSPCNVVNK